MSMIHIRAIANDDLVTHSAELEGLQVQTDFMDIKGRFVSGLFAGATVLPSGRIGIKVNRYLDSRRVMDSASVPPGNDPMDRKWRTTVHLPDGHPVLALVDAESAKVSA